MNKKKALSILPDEAIINKIYFIRGQKVMLDSDLAELYTVPVKVLNQAIKRNIDRFPDDFMFQLTTEEWQILKSQIVTSSWGGKRKLPYAFTEQGVAMLSSVLNSDIAIKVNIQIIRLFTKMREMVMTNKDLLLRMEKVEKELISQGESIETVFYYLDKFIKYEERPKEEIGFKQKT
ncbi:MAG: ORF6N domain-containing protein [Chitinophagales bacterium]